MNLLHELDPRPVKHPYTPKPEAWLGPLVLIERCLYLEAWVCSQNIEQRNGRCIWPSYDWESRLCLLEVGRTEFCLAKVFEPLSHTAPNKPTDVLLASCTGMWVRSHVFWKSISLLHTTWFLRWLLLSESPACWQCLEQAALEGGRKCFGLDRWPLDFPSLMVSFLIYIIW